MTENEAATTFARAGVSILLTNPNLPDNPIVYVNDAFERATGYRRKVAVSRNCRFLQGDDTDPDQRRRLREAIAMGRETTVDILNHRADGTRVTNRLLVSPVRDREDRITYFLGIQKVLTPEEARLAHAVSADEAMREIQHRVKNHLAMIVGLIRLQSREAGAQADYGNLARRIESLQILYEEMSHAGPAGDRIGLGAYLSRICSAIAHLDGRPGIRLAIDMAPLSVSVETAARMGLILSEVVTNALEHAFIGRSEGLLDVRLEDGGGTARVTVTDDGVGLAEGTAWPDMASMGGRIVAGLVDGLDARLHVDTGPKGTRVTLDVPAAMMDS